MKTKLLVLLLMAGSSLFAGSHVFFGIGVGGYGYGYYAPPPPQPVVVYARPACPGPGYVWVDGYSYPSGPRYYWRAGYWGRPPYVGARWVGPRYERHRYYHGHWRR